MIEAFAAALLLGGVNTIVDVVFSELKLASRPIYVLARLVLICYCVGGIVGARARQLLMGSTGGLMIGVVVTAVYYLLEPALGWTALAVAWTVFWLAFGLLEALLSGGSIVGGVVQGVAAALLSGGFYYGIGNLWPPARGSEDPAIWRGLVSWSASFLPGFVLLFWRRE